MLYNYFYILIPFGFGMFDLIRAFRYFYGNMMNGLMIDDDVEYIYGAQFL